MEFNKQVSNPMLIGTIELMKADRSKEHHNMLVNEILKAQFLTPADVNSFPTVNAECKTEVSEDTRIQFPRRTAPEGEELVVG